MCLYEGILIILLLNNNQMGNCIQGNSVIGDPKIVPIKRVASLKKSRKNT